MTERSYHPPAIFQPVYGCNQDTDELQIELQLVSRLSEPPVDGGQIGVRQVVGDYEFRYSPPGNTRKLIARFVKLPRQWMVFAC
jgi:kremen protein